MSSWAKPDAYHYETITKAIRLINAGAQFIATNPDTSGPTEHGIVPGCGAMAALIQTATGKAPFFVGKPNPLMMRTALNYLDIHSEDTVMVGDRMDTDIIAGVESGMETVLVLSGVTAPRGDRELSLPADLGAGIDRRNRVVAPKHVLGRKRHALEAICSNNVCTPAPNLGRLWEQRARRRPGRHYPTRCDAVSRHPIHHHPIPRR